jgi:cytochrome c-type biogenesis protein
MPEFMLAIGSAFWLGILTSISPCPLATNIAAISYVGRNLASPINVFMGGVLYTAGRSFAYLAIGVILVSSLLSAPSISFFLQTYMNKVLGPVLILTGLVLTGVISLNFFSGAGISARFQNRLEKMGMAGAILMGVVFALSFCPVSAALFFGSLIPVALKYQSGVFLPSVYGIATGLPVVIFSVFVALGANRVATAYNRVAAFEWWARRITGGIFILAGIYYCLEQFFHISVWEWFMA